MTTVNDDSSIVSEQSFKLIDDARGVTYNCPMFIIQATVVSRFTYKYYSPKKTQKGQTL